MSTVADAAVTYAHILVDREGAVVTITFNRPERMNAFNWRLGAELRHAVHQADDDDDVRAIVITGAGKAFCAGQDLGSGEGAFQGGDGAEREERRRVTEALRVPHTRPYWEMNTPIIGAINGAAVGAGLTMPMQWDLRVVAEDAKLGFVFNRRGVLPELNAALLIPQMAGLPRALDLLITGRIFSGREAVDWGLCNEALPADEVLVRAQEIARDIAVNVAPVSAAIIKRLVYENAALGTTLAAVQKRNHDLFGWVARQADAREGPAAFMQKRDPAWKLRKNSDFPEDVFASAGNASERSR
jgi:enoyl-CoA hydratase/carnithine racemase